MFRRLGRPVVSFLVVAALIVTSQAIGNAQNASSGTLQIGGSQDPVSLDPHIASSVDLYMLRSVYEPLVDVDPETLDVFGVLAESWEASRDGRSFTFRLRRGVKFSDGTALDAVAVQQSIDRLRRINRGSAWVVEPMKSVTVVNPQTVRIDLARAFPFLRALPLVYIVSPTAVAKNDKQGDLARAWLHENSAGTGPYILDSWIRGQLVSFRRHEGYWGRWAGNHFQRVVMRAPLDPSIGRLMLEKGDLDILLNFSFDDLPALEAHPGITVFKSGSQQQLYLRMNYRYGPTKDRRVRQAIAAAWDPRAWEAIVQNTRPSDGPAPIELLGKGYRSPLRQTFDLGVARRLMEEAGHGSGLTLNYVWDQGNEYKRIFGELLQGQLAKIGVKMTISGISPAAFFARAEKVREEEESANAMHLFLLRAIPRIPDPYSFLYFLYHSQAQAGFGRNYMLYSNPRVDGVIESAISEPDPTKALQLYRQAHEIIIPDVPDVFIEKTVFVLPLRKTIRGFKFRSSEQWFSVRFYELSRQR